MQLIDGKATAASIKKEIAAEVELLDESQSPKVIPLPDDLDDDTVFEDADFE